MEEYEDIENNTFNNFDESGEPDMTTVTEGQEHKAVNQKEQMVRQLAVGGERNWSRNAGVHKASGEIMAKRAKMREM